MTNQTQGFREEREWQLIVVLLVIVFLIGIAASTFSSTHSNYCPKP